MTSHHALVLGAAVLLALAGSHTAQARPRLGLEFTPQYTGFTPSSQGSFDVTQRYRWTLQGGVVSRWDLSPSVTLASGLLYGEHANRQETSTLVTLTGGGSFTFPLVSPLDARLRQFVVPLRLEIRRGAWRLGAGPEARWLAHADHRWAAPVVPLGPRPAAAPGRIVRPQALIFESVAPGQWYDATALYHRWSADVAVAVGRETRMGAHRLGVDLRWVEGLTRQQPADLVPARLRAAQLAFGWSW